MNEEASLDLETLLSLEEIVRIGRCAVQKAQEESRRLGVPNVYSINGFLYYELPSGQLSLTDPLAGQDSPPSQAKTPQS